MARRDVRRALQSGPTTYGRLRGPLTIRETAAGWASVLPREARRLALLRAIHAASDVPQPATGFSPLLTAAASAPGAEAVARSGTRSTKPLTSASTSSGYACAQIARKACATVAPAVK